MYQKLLLSSATVLSSILANMSAAYLFFALGSSSTIELLNRMTLCIVYAVGAILFDREARNGY